MKRQGLSDSYRLGLAAHARCVARVESLNCDRKHHHRGQKTLHNHAAPPNVTKLSGALGGHAAPSRVFAFSSQVTCESGGQGVRSNALLGAPAERWQR